ncbi:hypothetical protein GCM10011579_033120 [Streptomyces albiflavescens]|uniref:Uncharacterized protein n=1 Tax=Streptomyces albiflavescens TaxID=1623582 RepID=A0A917Y3Y0_9ACTN|nr:hypothetical protein [Streptomyces albiflavescens]GGN64086.1 hypothetical protein GCM10011579_033120 [Streptomyces albiflavescens]
MLIRSAVVSSSSTATGVSTDLARTIAVLARAQQDATRNRRQIANQLRSLLRKYYPAALDAFTGWANGMPSQSP